MSFSGLRVSGLKRIFPAFALALLLAGGSGVQMHAQTQPDNAGGGRLSTPAAQSVDDNNAEKDEKAEYLHSASVRAIGAKLGMNPEQAATVFTIANFIVLAGLVGWFLMRALPKTFRNRNSAIQKHLVEARTATEEASARLSGVEARLAKLDGEIAAMRKQADNDAAAEEQRIKAHVEEEKQKILNAAEQEISAATTAARRQIQQYAAELAIEQAARKLVVTAETDRLLVEDFARRLGGGEN